MSESAPGVDPFIEGFFLALGRETGLDEAGFAALRAEAEPRARELAEASADLVLEKTSQRWVGFASALLACYRGLSARVGEEPAREVIDRAITGPFQAKVREFLAQKFGITEENAEEAWDRFVVGFKEKAERTWGPGFTYAQEIREPRRQFVNVTRCIFNDFFRRNGAPELTPLLCAYDRVWADELGKPPYGIGFERPTTLAKGGDACRFQFTRRLPGGPL
jgi:hypothetical protein